MVLQLNFLKYNAVENGISEVSAKERYSGDEMQSKIKNYLEQHERELERLGYSETVIQCVIDYAGTQLELTFIN